MGHAPDTRDAAGNGMVDARLAPITRPRISDTTRAKLARLAAELSKHDRCQVLCPDSRRLRAQIDRVLDAL